MLRALSPDSGAKVSDRNPLLRLVAQDNTITMCLNDVEAGFGAEVEEEGTCFFIYRKFLPLVRSYTKQRRLTITVSEQGIEVGNTRISAALWEVSVFPDPRTPVQLSSKNAASRDKQGGRRRKRTGNSESPSLF